MIRNIILRKEINSIFFKLGINIARSLHKDFTHCVLISCIRIYAMHLTATLHPSIIIKYWLNKETNLPNFHLCTFHLGCWGKVNIPRTQNDADFLLLPDKCKQAVLTSSHDIKSPNTTPWIMHRIRVIMRRNASGGTSEG